MGKRTSWELGVSALKEKGVSQETIDIVLKDNKSNKSKFEALKPLLKKHKIFLNIGDNTPTLQEFFGKEIANLLVRQRELSTQIGDSIALEKKIKSKNVEEAIKDINDKKILLEYLQNEANIAELKIINKDLENKGLVYKPSPKCKESSKGQAKTQVETKAKTETKVENKNKGKTETKVENKNKDKTETKAK